jgi:multicomponent K+:H+ antiporter subunit F
MAVTSRRWRWPSQWHWHYTGWRGPRAQDRVLGLDTLYVNSMLQLLVFGIRTGSTLYFEASLAIAVLGFVATVALAKFLMRGEAIE